MRFLSEATTYLWFKLLLLVLVGVLVALGPKTRRTAIEALVAFPIANGLTDLFKHLLPFERPCTLFTDWTSHGIGCSESFGTASAHSANMAAIAFVFAYHLRWWGVPWIVIAIATGVSRVYVGVHFPSQVLLGWGCGTLVGFLVTEAWQWYTHRTPNVNQDNGQTDEP